MNIPACNHKFNEECEKCTENAEYLTQEYIKSKPEQIINFEDIFLD